MSSRVGPSAANRYLALRASAIQGITPERIAAAGEEFFTEWDAAIRERLSQANANAVSPDDVMKLFLVKGSLQIQFCEVHAGSELGGVEIEFDRTQDSAVLIEEVVAVSRVKLAARV